METPIEQKPVRYSTPVQEINYKIEVTGDLDEIKEKTRKGLEKFLHAQDYEGGIDVLEKIHFIQKGDQVSIETTDPLKGSHLKYQILPDLLDN